MEMLYCGVMEKDLKMLERNLPKLEIKQDQRKDFDKIMSDIYMVLNQNGYEKCTEIIERIFCQ